MDDQALSLPALVEQARGEDDYLEDLRFSGEKWEGLDCSEMDFQRVSFQGCQFLRCDFTKASFYQCGLEGCLFLECRFGGVYWKELNMARCKAEGADLRKSHWKQCTVSDSIFRYANLSGGVWDRAAFTRCSFQDAFLTEMRLIKPGLEQVDFTKADLFRTPLKGVDLSACTIGGITVSQSHEELKGAKINPGQAVDLVHLLGVKIL